MKRLHSRIPGSVAKTRLDEYLVMWLPMALGKQISKTKIRTLLLSGAVYVNRHRNKNGTTPLYAGAIIEVYYDENKIEHGQPLRIEQVRFDTNRVVFEDEWLMIVDKPAGLPTQPTIDPNRANLFDILKKFIDQREQTQGCYVGLHHRLDRDTSGLVLFTKKEEANKGVSELFSQKLIQKTYQCLVWRSPNAPQYKLNEQFTIENYLGKISAKNENSRFGAVTSGGDVAITHFRVLECFRDVYWLEAQPHTGRTHQIRVHCSENFLPILGDPVYSDKTVVSFTNAPRLMLHAGALSFTHPITQEKILVTSPLPEDFIQVLGTLKA